MTPSADPHVLLATLRDETLAQVDQLERELTAIIESAAEGAAGGDDEHDPEGATVAFERQHVAALLDRARGQLTEIDSAFARLESGRYGICEICGQRIDADRLAARPATRTCVRCAAARPRYR